MLSFLSKFMVLKLKILQLISTYTLTEILLDLGTILAKLFPGIALVAALEKRIKKSRLIFVINELFQIIEQL